MWFLVSYRRAEQCRQSIESLLQCGISTPGVLVVNGRDNESEYRSIRLPKDWNIEVLPTNHGVCGAMRWAFRNFPSEPCYSLLCDDEFVHTKGFDVEIMRAAGSWGIAHGNDGWRTQQGWYHTCATFGGELVRAVGWWPLPRIWHAYFDNAWQLIGNEFGLRRYCTHILTTHLNVDVDSHGGGTAQWDDTYQEGRRTAAEDKAIFDSWVASDYQRLRHRLRSVLR